MKIEQEEHLSASNKKNRTVCGETVRLFVLVRAGCP